MSLKGDLLDGARLVGRADHCRCACSRTTRSSSSRPAKSASNAAKTSSKVVREAVAQNQWPLFGATAIGIIAFAAIGVSEDASGEVANSLFWVILISLSLSWLSSVTVTPLLSYLVFKPNAGGTAEQRRSVRQASPFRIYRSALGTALQFRWAVVGICVVALIAAALRLHRTSGRAFSRTRTGRSLWWTRFCRPARTFAKPRRSPPTCRSTFKSYPA